MPWSYYFKSQQNVVARCTIQWDDDHRLQIYTQMYAYSEEKSILLNQSVFLSSDCDFGTWENHYKTAKHLQIAD